MSTQATTLFTCPAKEITLDTIKAFCTLNLKECETIEYKQDLTNRTQDKIVETIAAMANTDGGLIFIGIEEQRNDGSKKGLPGRVAGFLPPGNTDTRQSIANVCRSCFQPHYIPEIIEIPTDDANRIIVLIRINQDAVPSLPVFHRQKGIKIRSGEDNVFATPAQMREISASSNSVGILSAGHNLTGTIPNWDEFTWCTIGITLPMKRNRPNTILTTENIMQLKVLIENHNLFGKKMWTEKYYPRRLKDNLEETPSSICLRRNINTVDFFPIKHFRAKLAMNEYWYSIHFDNRGLLVATIGLGKTESNPDFGAHSIATAFYTILDLFSQPQLHNTFPDLLWDIVAPTIFYQVQVSEFILDKSVIDYIRDDPAFIPPGDYGGPQGAHQFETICPEKIAKIFTETFLASAGCWGYEESLAKLKFT